MALSTAAHREPTHDDGTPGRVLIVDTIVLSGVLQNVTRAAVHRGRKGDDDWGERTITGDLPKPSRFDLGIVDADGFAKLLADQTVEVFISRDIEGPARALMLYGMHNRLQLSCSLSPGRFAWLWGEMMSRPDGRLRISLSLPALSDAKLALDNRLSNSRYFADGTEAYSSDLPGREIEFRIDDDWGRKV